MQHDSGKQETIILSSKVVALQQLLDVYEQTMLERLKRSAIQHAVTRILAESASTSETFPRILAEVCNALGWDVGAIWNVDTQEKLLICTDVWHQPTAQVEDFEAVTRQTVFRSGVGLPGRVWAGAAPAWIPDVTNDHNFPRAPMAVKNDLHGALGFPIKASGRVIGIIEFFSKEIQQPDEDLLAMLASVGGQIGQFIERKQAESELQESQQRLQAILDNCPAVIYLKDTGGRYILVNRYFETLFRATRERIKGKTDYDLSPKEVADAFRANDRKVLASGVPMQFEEAEPYEDGLHTYLSIKFPLYDPSGIPYAICGISTDITERRRNEESLQASESRYHSLVVATSQITWTTDAAGDVVSDIPTWRAFTGQSEETVRGRGWLEAIHPDDREASVRLWSEAVARTSVYEAEFRLRKYDGTYRHFAVRGVPVIQGEDWPRRYWQSPDFSLHGVPVVTEPGRVNEWVGICTDITERQMAERALAQHAEELARSNAELQRFAYVASHDLHEPLRTVASYCKLLERHYADKLDARAREFIGFAVEGANWMQLLIDGLLAYSRVDSHGKPFEQTDCAALLNTVLSNLRLAITESGAVVTHDPLPVVAADRTQLGEVFQNLIGNAIKFRGDRQPEIHIAAEIQDSEWQFAVRDNGIGMDPKHAERIFEVFQRLHTRDEYPGTGIGLAICKKILQRHAGRIWVQTRPAAGSVFYFTLPRQPPGAGQVRDGG